MVQYYTLAQAAEILRISPEQLKAMAQRKEIRAFQDRSGWRFRAQEIDEMARARGYGSDPELPLGEAAAGNDVFNFSLDPSESDEVPIGKEPANPEKRSGSGSRKTSASKSPPKASSDSDVRLVLDGSDVDFSIESESKGPASKAPVSPRPKVGSSSKSKSRLVGPKEDSGVRIVPLDQPTDSDVKIRPSGEQRGSPSDSDIRIEEMTGGRVQDQMVTEEIDLDAEQRKADASAKAKRGRQRPKPPSSASALPTSSPFELSENDINMENPPPSPAAEKAEDDTDSSSDFELKPMDDSSPVFDSDELSVVHGDDEVGLGELSGAKGASGINLQDPADSGISLEQKGSGEVEFELSLDAGDTPKPTTSKKAADSSSEFELSLSEGDSSPTDEGSSSSEFELSLDSDGGELAVDEGSSDLTTDSSGSDSDSEFELTLDESGGLSAVEEGESASGEGEDIFETDFEVPALDEESGSEAVALDEADTDLESSEFDLSLEGESESGSQVVPLEDEEEVDEGAATVQRRAVGAVAEDEEGLEDIGEALDEDLDEAPVLEDEEREPVAAAAAAPAPPAEWGAMPALVMLPCTIVLFLVGLMSFELIQGMWGYHRGTKVSNLLIKPIAKMVSGEDKLPGD
jgi:excisionase family DNA binding protein